MAKFIRIIVNLCIICFLLTGVALIVPQFVGITTVIVDDDITEGNVDLGAVVYGKTVKLSELGVGDKILRSTNTSVYVSEIKSIDGASSVYTVEGKDGAEEDVTLRNTGEKALVTVPFIGYVSIAMQTFEGRIILGLALAFLIILFILSEIWKNNSDEDEDEEAEAAETAEGQDEPLSRKERKALKKEEKRRKKREQEEADDEEEETPVQQSEQTVEEPMEEEETEIPAPAEELILETIDYEEETPEEEMPEGETGVQGSSEPEPDDFAAAIQAALEQEIEQPSEEPGEGEEQAEIIPDPDLEEENEPGMPKKMAIPVLTADELLERAAIEGDEPKVVEDKEEGITFIDYSDIL